MYTLSTTSATTARKALHNFNLFKTKLNSTETSSQKSQHLGDIFSSGNTNPASAQVGTKSFHFTPQRLTVIYAQPNWFLVSPVSYSIRVAILFRLQIMAAVFNEEWRLLGLAVRVQELIRGKLSQFFTRGVV